MKQSKDPFAQLLDEEDLPYELPEKAYLLRTVAGDMTSHDGFVWPIDGPVEAPDWDPTPTCGGGLHGLLWGEGDGRQLNWSPDANWLVVEVDAADVVDLDGKVKVPRGIVVHCGDRPSATSHIVARGARGVVVGRTAVAGDGGTATAGYRGTAVAGEGGTAVAGDGGTAVAGDGGTATAGFGGTATAGFGGTATVGYRGTATAENGGTATAGDGGTATAGYRGIAVAGDRGTATAGDRGTATAGEGGTATVGNWGTATAGYRGTATAGEAGTATAGDGGTVIVWWWNGSHYCRAVGYVGEDGLKANVAYKVVNGKLTEVPDVA